MGDRCLLLAESFIHRVFSIGKVGALTKRNWEEGVIVLIYTLEGKRQKNPIILKLPIYR